jgi:broad specificity phosphatase PhoE
MAELLLIRHAERPEIPKNAVGHEVLLTKKGIADTLAFSKKITKPIITIHSSPIERCHQTAKIIAEVADYHSRDIVLDTDLGDPGFIIENGDLAWLHWKDKGHQKVNEHLLSGTAHWNGFADLNKAVAMFDEKIRNHLLLKPDGLHIWVTHDTILATFVSRILQNQLSMKQWPQYLDYLSVTLNKDKIDYRYSNAGTIG